MKMLDKKLYESCLRNNLEEVKDNLGKGADPNGYCTEKGFFPLHHSACFDNKDIADALIQHGASGDVGVMGDQGGISLPLHIAAMFGSTDVLPILLR